jgi:hypothetical protein
MTDDTTPIRRGQLWEDAAGTARVLAVHQQWAWLKRGNGAPFTVRVDRIEEDMHLVGGDDGRR